MAALDRETLQTWNVTNTDDMVDAINEAEEIVNGESDGAYLSFIYMTKGEKNVDKVSLIKIDLSDSFAYELELS